MFPYFYVWSVTLKFYDHSSSLLFTIFCLKTKRVYLAIRISLIKQIILMRCGESTNGNVNKIKKINHVTIAFTCSWKKIKFHFQAGNSFKTNYSLFYLFEKNKIAVIYCKEPIKLEYSSLKNKKMKMKGKKNMEKIKENSIIMLLMKLKEF